jgi:transcriptional regulator with XRE-family HTH domain
MGAGLEKALLLRKGWVELANSHTDKRAEEAARFERFVAELKAYFCRNLRACREHKGLTQQGLATMVGTSKTWVNALELGRKPIGLGTIVRFSVALRVDAAQLLAPKLDKSWRKPSPIQENKRGRLGMKTKKSRSTQDSA